MCLYIPLLLGLPTKLWTLTWSNSVAVPLGLQKLPHGPLPPLGSPSARGVFLRPSWPPGKSSPFTATERRSWTSTRRISRGASRWGAAAQVGSGSGWAKWGWNQLKSSWNQLKSTKMSQVGDETLDEFNQGWRIEPFEDGLTPQESANGFGCLQNWTSLVPFPYHEILSLPCPWS